MRRFKLCWSILSLGASSGAEAQARYLVDLQHGDRTAWVGSAQVVNEDAAAKSFIFCLVRKEYINTPAYPRTLLKTHGTIERESRQVTIKLERALGGPIVPEPGITLSPQSRPDEAPNGVWLLEEDFQMDDEGEVLPSTTPDLVTSVTLRERVDIESEVFPFVGESNPDEIVYFQSRKDQNNDRESTYNMAVYDGMTSIQARKFEKGKIFFDLYGPGVVSTVLDSSKIAQVQAMLDAEGEGARVLNAELAGCPRVEQDFVVAVPVGLELYYARKLQRSGLVVAAYPDVQPRDPAWSDPFNFATAQLRTVVRSRQVGSDQKYAALWAALDQSLRRFAAARRRDFSSEGGLTRLGGTPQFMYRAEISGRSLALCAPNRWEKIVVQAAANGFNTVTGEATITINFSDGFFGNGPTMPSDIRFKDNEIPDGDLARVQELYVGTAQRGGTIATAQQCR